jgi:hypothetical protein
MSDKRSDKHSDKRSASHRKKKESDDFTDFAALADDIPTVTIKQEENVDPKTLITRPIVVRDKKEIKTKESEVKSTEIKEKKSSKTVPHNDQKKRMESDDDDTTTYNLIDAANAIPLTNDPYDMHVRESVLERNRHSKHRDERNTRNLRNERDRGVQTMINNMPEDGYIIDPRDAIPISPFPPR